MAETALFLLDGFKLTSDGVPVELPPVAQRVVAYLALQERPIARTVLAGRLWPDTTDAKAGTNLRAALSKVKIRGGPLVRASATSIAIDEAVVIDVRVAQRAAARLFDDADTGAGEVDHRVFTGILLPELIDAWVVVEREQLRQLFLHALEALSQRLVGAGHSAAAVRAALAAVNGDPLRESSTRTLIQAHLAEGNWAEAWRAFDTYRDVAEQELGLAPSAELTRLIGADLADRRSAPR